MSKSQDSSNKNANELSPRSDESEEETTLYITTRTGMKEILDTNKIVRRFQTLTRRSPKINHINPYELMLHIASGLKSGISTYEIDEYSGNAAASLSISNPYYMKLASRLIIDNHQKNTVTSFKDKMQQAYLRLDVNGNVSPLLSHEFFKYVEKHQYKLESMIDYDRDFLFDFFGTRTFQSIYSMKIAGKCIERMQDSFMRVAIYIHQNTCERTEEGLKQELANIKQTYDAQSKKLFTHASPGFFNAGTLHPQLSSCFLLGTADSLDGIEDTGKSMARISKWSGGIGVHVNCWRSKGTHIRGTNGKSNGIVPFLREYNAKMRAWNQGGKRMGSAAIYLMPHHPDIVDFLKLKLPSGVDEERARDLFYALWIPDIFMERVKSGGTWSMFDPDECGDLSDLYGEAYTARYLQLEQQKKYKRQIPARQLWELVYDSNKQKGMPYLCSADAVNNHSMHQNLGTIRSSNLCVAGDTLILTDSGYYPIKELAETNSSVHIIWNGYEFKPATFAQTGVRKELLRITFSDGVELKCTSEHRFAINSNNATKVLTAKELQVGATLIEHKFPLIDKDTSDINTVFIDTIPINYSKDIKLKWLAGYLDANATLINDAYQTYSADKQLLTNIKLLCNTLGVNPAIIQDNTLYFSNAVLNTLYDIGLSVTKLPTIKLTNSATTTISITKIEKLEELEDTYCFNEPTLHMGIFNGIIAMNCSEIMQYSDKDEYGTCNLASVSLPACIIDTYTADELLIPEAERRQLDHEFPLNPKFDFNQLLEVVKITVVNMNHIIDKNYYPTVECKRSNMRHRPLGIGLQGLADAYIKMRYPYDSAEARRLNVQIAETMYYAALSQSTRMCRDQYLSTVRKCRTDGQVSINIYSPSNYDDNIVTYADYSKIPKNIHAYPSMFWNGGSPLANGKFHWELYSAKASSMYDWETLRSHVQTYGVKNSLLIACMPTASTSQFLGNNEGIEPYTSNLYKRKTLSGEFIVINRWLIHDLYRLGLWNQQIKDYLILTEGSIQHIDGIPNDLKALYKTAWELPQEELIQQAADRQPFVDQGQSLNWYIRDVTIEEFTKLSFKAWKLKLKTWKYYLHSRPAITPIFFTLDPNMQKEMMEKIEKSRITRNPVPVEPVEPVCDLCSA